MPFVINDGVKIWFEVEGEGPPLMLMHGTTGSSKSWRRLGITDALRDEYKLILVDARGHGKSDKPHDPVAYLPEPKTNDIKAILDQLDIESTHYMGYSMGGRIGFDVVAKAPNLFRSMIAGGAGPSPQSLLEMSSQVYENTIEQIVEMREAVNGRMADDFRTDFLANDIHAIRVSLDPAVLDQEELYRAKLKKFSKPTLMFVGTEDPRIDDIETMTEQMPQAEFISIEGRDHGGAMEAILGLMPQIKSFLERVSQSQNSTNSRGRS